MAMTKAEKARVADLERELALRKALAWGVSAPEPMPVPIGNATISGWRMTGDLRNGLRVERAWSQSHRHGLGRSPTRDGNASQCGLGLYRTRLDALMAARVLLTWQAAEILAKLDSDLDAERQRPTDEQP